jgi:hypothetical protein
MTPVAGADPEYGLIDDEADFDRTALAKDDVLGGDGRREGIPEPEDSC